MLSFYEIKSFTRALRNADHDHEVSVPKCPGKWLYFINQGKLHTCDKFQNGIREVFLSFPGDLKILVKSDIF